MGSVVVDRERCRQVKKKMYLPDVDEYNSSSEPLTGELCVTDRSWSLAEVDIGQSQSHKGYNCGLYTAYVGVAHRIIPYSTVNSTVTDCNSAKQGNFGRWGILECTILSLN